MESKKIVHLVNRDKFTSGYINFFEHFFCQDHNTYVVQDKGYNLQIVNESNIIYIHNEIDFVRSKELKKKLFESDKIIISGVFGIERGVTLFYPKLLKKTYLHFWGADFYYFRDKLYAPQKLLARSIKKYCIKHCKAWINLIPGDYDEIVRIIGIQKKHFVAQMPGNPERSLDYDSIMNEAEPHNGCRIIVGNSATKTNRHAEVFEMLKHLKDEDIEIICPVSYGDEKYGQTVIEKGKEIFGNKFKALTEYMEPMVYYRLLASCDVGIFNNDRQQGMGNISMLIGFGKKVYMCSDTAMWKSYCDRGYKVFNIEELAGIDIDELNNMTDSDKDKNIRTHRNIYCNRLEYAKNSWLKVLND